MKGSGFIALILAALLVAMLVPAFAFGANNGTDAVSMMGTKINAQEEVAGIRAGENMTALAVPPWSLALIIITMVFLVASTVAVYFYKSTHSAGGDGLIARFT
jgi:hypothetical protein